MFLSGSKDSTLKVWDLKTKKLMYDLPGHSDEIYAVDWSPDGEKVISGGKDKLIKIWKNWNFILKYYNKYFLCKKNKK